MGLSAHQLFVFGQALAQALMVVMGSGSGSPAEDFGNEEAAP